MRIFQLLLWFTFPLALIGQSEKQWMGSRITNTALFLDPTEVQMSGSITGLLKENALENQYIPFNIGASQSIVSKQIEENKGWEIVTEAGVFTQFEWRTIDGEQQRNLLNTDYRITFSYNRKINNKVTYRMRFFHVSSHLGDDYILRNGINKYSENKVNYEQFEFTYFYKMEGRVRVYAGLGSVVRPNSTRLPFSYHFGSHQNISKPNKKWGWSWGCMLKGFQETDFTPGIKAAIGPAYFTVDKPEPIRIVLEYYKGHLPYSQLESHRISWLGLGIYFYI